MKKMNYLECCRNLIKKDFQFDTTLAYEPEKDWNETSKVSFMQHDGSIAYKRNFVADIGFFDNKCFSDFDNDPQKTLEWYKERYAFLKGRDGGIVKTCLRLRYKDSVLQTDKRNKKILKNIEKLRKEVLNDLFSSPEYELE